MCMTAKRFIFRQGHGVDRDKIIDAVDIVKSKVEYNATQ